MLRGCVNYSDRTKHESNHKNLMAHFEIYTDDRGEYRWRLRADNGELIADSGEGYTDEDDCREGIRLVKEEASSAEVENQA